MPPEGYIGILTEPKQGVFERPAIAFSRRVLSTGRENLCYLLGRLLSNKAFAALL
jgi:hypothetical protein